MAKRWGNALGGWKKQPRNKKGQFASKGGGSFSRKKNRANRKKTSPRAQYRRAKASSRAQYNRDIAAISRMTDAQYARAAKGKTYAGGRVVGQDLSGAALDARINRDRAAKRRYKAAKKNRRLNASPAKAAVRGAAISLATYGVGVGVASLSARSTRKALYRANARVTPTVRSTPGAVRR